MTQLGGVTALTAETHFTGAVGVEFAYRRFGRPTEVPLVMLQHFRGNLDKWDPALTDSLAAQREVILVDYPGVGSSSGEPDSTVASTARRRSDCPGSRARRWSSRATNDLMIPTKLSHLMAGLIPDGQIRIYPDAGHGFLFQYPIEIAADVNAFLASDDGKVGS
jgi:pimeloyl-ACP methyl ester carboxylesterase